MNWVDIVILCVCTVLVLLGVKRGLVDQIFSAAAIIGGILCALIFYDMAGELLINRDILENRSIANIIGFLAIFLFSYIIIQVLGWLASKLVGTLKLGWLNRLSGGVVGFLIGVLVSSLFISAVNLFSDDPDSPVRNSVLAPYITRAYSTIKEAVPDNLRAEYDNAREIIREKGFREAARITDDKDTRKK